MLPFYLGVRMFSAETSLIPNRHSFGNPLLGRKVVQLVSRADFTLVTLFIRSRHSDLVNRLIRAHCQTIILQTALLDSFCHYFNQPFRILLTIRSIVDFSSHFTQPSKEKWLRATLPVFPMVYCAVGYTNMLRELLLR